ncbi:hypothetical protein [Leclercia adecarboxylata]|uniref:hypothetical protein n=1 Tax=Leclercia adecarboxylata TaxID=83655 RepID=UPI001118EC4A|nr:hypothetical protein [Leclercia adecarboxylata]QCZ30204.1 hypothetical protein FHN83_26935 [Leclercia adecarboxylata]
MTQKFDFSNLKCPKCGCIPEMNVRSRGMNAGSAEIRCPYSCLRYGTAFHSGHESSTRLLLVEKWKELLAEHAANEKQTEIAQVDITKEKG